MAMEMLREPYDRHHHAWAAGFSSPGGGAICEACAGISFQHSCPKRESIRRWKSILGLLILGAAWKSKLEIEAVGDDAVQAIESIKEFFLKENISVNQPERDFLAN